MNGQSFISGLKRSLFFLLGILVAIFVVSQEIVNYHCQQLCEEVQDAEEGSDSDEEKDIVYDLTTQVVLPVSGIELEPFQAVFIGEVIRESEEKPPFIPEVSLYDSPYFRTMFRQIQSPNAP